MREVAATTKSEKPDYETRIKLYGMLIDQLQKYNTILWQAPAALLAANMFVLNGLLQPALNRIPEKAWIIIAVVVFNGGFIFALWKIYRAQWVLIERIRAAEDELRPLFETYIPSFKLGKVRSAKWLLVIMSALDAWLLVYAVSLVAH